MTQSTSERIVLVLALALFTAPALGDDPPAPEKDAPGEQVGAIILHQALAIERVGRYGRQAIQIDPIQRAIVTGTWTTPATGDTVTRADGTTAAWESIDNLAGKWLDDPKHHSGYVLAQVESPSERVMLLHAAGHGMVYVNGEPCAGDPYRFGFVHLPILLRAGTNELLFHAGRGPINASLVPPRAAVLFNPNDATLPDLIVGDDQPAWGAIVVINATTQPQSNLSLSVTRKDDRSPSGKTRLPTLPPLATRKIAFLIHGPPAGTEASEWTLQLHDLSQTGQPVLDETTIRLGVRQPDAVHRRTFISDIDGSVQYFAVRPASPPPAEGARPALVLSLHGASVEATSQANAYAAKDWCTIVAPTNRRSFGFDWEDWGRLDAMEVLEQAAQRFNTDPARTYLTGHSMGGHGTWQIGAHFPDRFAAIAPSAGWISFWSYTGAAEYDAADSVQAILKRAVSPSDTPALARNYAMHGIYILHGDADDNVPVAQARTMVKNLAEFHRDFAYHEQPGAGHWWGDACVDWPPLFEFLHVRKRPEPREMPPVEFTTASPGVSATCRWATIEDQLHDLQPSSITLRYDAGARRFIGTTQNVTRLALDAQFIAPSESMSADLDGQVIEGIALPTTPPTLRFVREGDHWSIAGAIDPGWKHPARFGPFKEAFRNRFVLIYGTIGTEAENAWSMAKARFDAQTFWYRGNGSVDVLADRQADPTLLTGRNVILYGNADTNAAWPLLLADSPLQVRRGSIALGTRTMQGNDLACLAIRPRTDGRGNLDNAIGIVAGSGLIGMRLTDRLPYFVSGVAYPDVTILSPEALERGPAGIRVAGFFGSDWSIESGDFAWNTASDSP